MSRSINDQRQRTTQARPQIASAINAAGEDDQGHEHPLPTRSRRHAIADDLRMAARAENTRVAYDKAWRRFANYCSARRIAPLEAQPHHVADFFVNMGLKPRKATGRRLAMGTLRIYRSALNRRFAEVGEKSPAATTDVGDVLAGLARLRGDAPRRVRALREFEIATMLDRCPDSRFGRRDAAMLALGFAAALRRSELCGLEVRDLGFMDDHRMIVSIRRSKDRPDGQRPSGAGSRRHEDKARESRASVAEGRRHS